MKVTKLLALVVILGVVGTAVAQDKGEKGKKRARPKGVFGKIVKIEGTSIVVAKRARKGQEATEVTVKTDDNTKVSIDRKEAKVSDLKEGMFVFVTPETGTAEKIHARTKMRERKPKKEK